MKLSVGCGLYEAEPPLSDLYAASVEEYETLRECPSRCDAPKDVTDALIRRAPTTSASGYLSVQLRVYFFAHPT